MSAELAAILWTSLVLVLIRPGVLGGVILAIVLFEVFYLLSSLPIDLFQNWPFLRPSSLPLSLLAFLLLIVISVYRFRRPNRPSSK